MIARKGNVRRLADMRIQQTGDMRSIEDNFLQQMVLSVCSKVGGKGDFGFVFSLASSQSDKSLLEGNGWLIHVESMRFATIGSWLAAFPVPPTPIKGWAGRNLIRLANLRRQLGVAGACRILGGSG